jgi:hypothetical protein
MMGIEPRAVAHVTDQAEDLLRRGSLTKGVELRRVLEPVHDDRCRGVIAPEDEQTAISVRCADRCDQRSDVRRIIVKGIGNAGWAA